MNFLAHAYLSFQQPPVLVGNMISDFVKGRKKFDFPDSIRKGIELHRAIDQFTDDHPLTKEAKAFFAPVYRLYSGAFVDIVYDHFLARDPLHFSGDQLKLFSADVYHTLDDHTGHLPAPFARMLPYMKAQDWLYNYRHREGLENSFGGLARRSLYIKETHSAIRIFQENEKELEQLYREFIKEVVPFAENRLREMGGEGGRGER